MKPRWKKLITDIISECHFKFMTVARVDSVRNLKSDIMDGFIMDLFKAFPTYEMAQSVSVGDEYRYSSTYSANIFTFVKLSKSMLIDYIKRIDPELKTEPWSNYARRLTNHNYSPRNPKNRNKTYIHLDVTKFNEDNWNTLKYFGVRTGYTDLYPPHVILKNVIKAKKEEQKKLQEKIAEVHEILHPPEEQIQENIIKGIFKGTKVKAASKKELKTG